MAQYSSMRAIKPKRWSVNAISSEQESLQVYCDGRPLQTKLGSLDDVSPVECLLVAVATCFALSVRAVVSARKLPRLPFEVVVSGEKASDPPSRLKQIAIVAIFRASLSPEESAAITADAKQLCVVTNSIENTPTISFSGRSWLPDPAPVGQ